MIAQQKSEESVLVYTSRVQDNVAKTFPKLAGANRQDLAVSSFCQGLRYQDVARRTANQLKGDVSLALRFAASVTAFGNNRDY